MRVLHLPYTYFPDPVGGTEVYVAQLAQELRTHNIESLVAAPGSAAATYMYAGVSVTRYTVSEPEERGEVYDAVGNPAAVASLVSILARERPDVLHIHAYTRGVPFEAGSAARELGIPVIVTYHTPTVTCARGSLIRNGEVVCDGALIVSRCAACMLRLSGLPGPVADTFGRLPTAVGQFVRAIAPAAGGLATPLRMTEIMKRRHDRIRNHLASATAVVAPSSWVAALVIGEGVPPERVLVSPQGTNAFSRPPRDRASQGGPVLLALPARYSREKGIEVVLNAMQTVPDADIRLDVFGPSQHAEAREYRRELEARFGRDSRIRFLDAVDPDQVVATLARADAAVVPSMWMETGPLVVLEAFAAGVPVIGSALGGIAERVRDGVDGLLVPPGNVAAWASVLALFAADPGLRARLAAGVKPPRRMADVAAEMAGLYERAIGPLRELPGTRPARPIAT
jgi:glycosyltransferase involved in cell wall biosynthesis